MPQSSQPQSSPTSPSWAPRILIGILLLVIAAYTGLVHCGFVNFDDGNHIYENPVVKDGLGLAQLRDAFTTFPGHLWVPLTWLSLSLDVTVFGLQPGAMHLVNLALHLAATALLYRAIVRLTGNTTAALIVAALFGVHPLNVESVAWITERKNVLSAVFWMLALGSYATYAREHRWRSYLVALVWFACGLMSKPAVVTLPCVLLLLDGWPLKRFQSVSLGRLIVEKLPFFVLAAGSSVMTMKAQAGGDAIVGTQYISLSSRIAYALDNWVWYLGKLAWPQSLGPYYNHPVRVPWAPAIAAAALLISITAVCLWKAKQRPYWLIGWLWYVGVLVPMIGFVQVGGVARADRFAYLPQIGIWLALAFTVSPLFERAHAKRMMLVAGAIVAGFAAVTSVQVSYWENSVSLFERALATTRNNYSALCHAAEAHAKEGNFERAAVYYQAALRISSDDADLWNSLGSTLLRWGKFPEALRHFDEASRRRPTDATFQYNAALTLVQLTRETEAERRLNQALALDPRLASAHYLTGKLAEKRGDRRSAIEHLQRASELRPDNAKVRDELIRLLDAEAGGSSTP